MADHPTKDELSGFVLGTLSPDSTDAVSKHVEHCPTCLETLHKLDPDRDTLQFGPQQPPVQADDSNAAKPAAVPSPQGGAVSADAGRAAGQVLSREQFLAAVRSSAAVDDDQWAVLEKNPAVTKARDGAALARALVENQVLSKYQATLIYHNKPKALQLGDYVVVDKIGAGGMGQVFKARHRHMKRVVAIKMLAKSAVNSAEAVKRFQREVEAAAKLLHKNIVTAFDAGQHNGNYFLVMEYIAGNDLASIVKSNGPLPVKKAVDYVRQAAVGLAFAHGKGVVHRDVKPANLLVDPEGTVKILDMGLARFDNALDGGAGVQDGLTQSGQVMGTVDFMAPEQALDTHTADARADVYSLGCTLHCLLTGENVYGGDTLVRKLLAHREQPIPSITAKRADVPAALDEVFRKMVAKRPEDRLQSMGEVIEALDKVVRSLKSPDMAGNLPDDFASFVKSHRNSGVSKPSTSQLATKYLRRKAPIRLIATGCAGVVLLLGVILLLQNGLGKVGGKRDVSASTATSLPKKSRKLAVDREVSWAAGEVPPPSGQPPATDAALQFDGNDMVEIPSLKFDPQGSYTLEAFITSPAKADNRFGIVFGMPDQSYLSFSRLSDWRWVYAPHERRLGIEMAISGAPARQTRTHLACVRDGQTHRLFVDGKPYSRTADIPSPAVGASPFEIGRDFRGVVDELRVSKVARYTSVFSVPERFEPDADTLGLYHFDEAGGNVLKDTSGNNRHGTITGAKWVRADGAALTAIAPLSTSGAPVTP